MQIGLWDGVIDRSTPYMILLEVMSLCSQTLDTFGTSAVIATILAYLLS